jgi:Domain of unknown function (DUF1996)
VDRVARPARLGVVAVIAAATAVAGVTAGAGPAAAVPPETAEWAVVCDVVGQAHDDPILMPRAPGQWHHLHTFGGNHDVTASSTGPTLGVGTPGCQDTADLSSYWQPTLVGVDGDPVKPASFRNYYRAGSIDDLGSIQPMPFGLKMVAGDARATSAQGWFVGYFCIESERHQVVSLHDLPVNCGGQNFLRARVHFPNCWDGQRLDSVDHVSHVAYSQHGRCPASHAVPIPQLAVEMSYPPGTTFLGQEFEGGLSGYGLHADVISAWAPNEMAALTEHCINGRRNCGGVSDRTHPLGGPDVGGVIPAPTPLNTVTPTTGTGTVGVGHRSDVLAPLPTGTEGLLGPLWSAARRATASG